MNIYEVQLTETNKGFPVIAECLKDVAEEYPNAHRIETKHKDVIIIEKNKTHLSQ